MVGNKHTTHHQGGNLKGILPEMCDDINLFSICTVVSSALARGKVQFLMIVETIHTTMYDTNLQIDNWTDLMEFSEIRNIHTETNYESDEESIPIIDDLVKI